MHKLYQRKYLKVLILQNFNGGKKGTETRACDIKSQINIYLKTNPTASSQKT
jgi:hypothetical protein